MELTIFGGKGFVGSEYVRKYGGVVNEREDYEVHSKDVLYFISTVHNYNVFDEPHLDIDTNLNVLITVLESWRKQQEKSKCAIDKGCFNFISSWFCYGFQKNPHNVREDAICDPRGFYSITKYCAEQLLRSYCQTYKLNYQILRLGNVIGPGDKKASAKKNAIQYMVNKIARNEDIEIYGDGTSYRDYIHVSDCAYAIHLVAKSYWVNEITNISNGKSWPLLRVLEFARAELNSTSKFKFIEPKEFHKQVQVESFYMNTDWLKQLGYCPTYVGEDLFRSLLEDACK
jgi:nucleoside-diphosphate-sugar epimerase